MYTRNLPILQDDSIFAVDSIERLQGLVWDYMNTAPERAPQVKRNPVRLLMVKGLYDSFTVSVAHGCDTSLLTAGGKSRLESLNLELAIEESKPQVL
jgi:hypothetical protein